MIISLQYLRALAVILVILVHISDKSRQYGTNILDFRDGRFGVDVFFVISGFVMYYVSLHKPAGLHTVIDFLKHRVIRIMPLYWMLTFVALIVYFILPISVYHGGEINILKSFFLVPTNFPEEKFLIPIGWTLVYEFYFYFIFSLALVFSNFRATIVVTTLTLLVLLGMYIECFKDMYLFQFLTNSLLLEFLFGVFLVKIYQYLDFKKLQFSFLFFSMFLLSYTLFSLGYKSGLRGIDLGVPAMFLVLSFLMLEDKIKAHQSTFVLNIGIASFSIYLIHPFVLSFTALIYKKIAISTFSSEIIFLALMLIGSVFSGFLTYHLFEKTFTKYFRSKLR